MVEKKDKQLSEKKKVPWWIIALLVLLAILYFTKSDNLDEYNYCVDDCVYDVQNCMDYPYFLSDACIMESDASGCLDELESCMADCEINYGN